MTGEAETGKTMIEKWEIKPDGADKYLYITGTSTDARLVQKKLDGYAASAEDAGAEGYAYRFKLTAAQEPILSKIETAVAEAVEQSKKVTPFIPATLESAAEEQYTAQKITDAAADSMPEDIFDAGTKMHIYEDLQASGAPSEGAGGILDQIIEEKTTFNVFEETSRGLSVPPAAPPITDAAQMESVPEIPSEPVITERTLSQIGKPLDMPASPDAEAEEAPAAPSFKEYDNEFFKHAPAQDNADSAPEDPFEALMGKTSLTSPAKPSAPIIEAEPSAEAEVSMLSEIMPHVSADFENTKSAASISASAAEDSDIFANVGRRLTDTFRLSRPKEDEAASAAPEKTPDIQAGPDKVFDMPQMPEVRQEAVAEEYDSMRDKVFNVTSPQEEPAAPSAPQAPMPAAPVPSAPPPPVPPAPNPGNTQFAPSRAQRVVPNSSLMRGHTRVTGGDKPIDYSVELADRAKHNWPLEIPLVPTYTFDSMIIGANRFAHATAISAIENPGGLYNPLVLYGETGSGKTHFLNAIGFALSKKFGQSGVFLTNGVRFSRGIQRYVAEGQVPKFEEFMRGIKALLIDDIHLTAVNDQNKDVISKCFRDFLAQKKQIVITSKYSPESLVKLEELIDFKLDAGWISELKTASGPNHTKIVKKMLADNNMDLNEEEIRKYFGNMSLGVISRTIKRAKVLAHVADPGNTSAVSSYPALLEKLLAVSGEDTQSAIVLKDFSQIDQIPRFGNGEWGRVGFFYPQDNANMFNWIAYGVGERAKELGVNGSYDMVLKSGYNTTNIISSAFKIANICDNKKLKAAVILGPSADVVPPAIRDNFYDIITHMLEIMLIRCGIINLEKIKAPSAYTKVVAELLR